MKKPRTCAVFSWALDNLTMNTHVNADPAELAKFSDLAHRWWDPESEFRPLHQINPLRLNWIDGLVSLNGKQVLDVGCGGGILSDAMARKGAQVTALICRSKPCAWRSYTRWRPQPPT
jgi:2-polyprenyl-6-hydroxyphenyl methylase/3-demethylubiquinone-9 3-methyltransferase